MSIQNTFVLDLDLKNPNYISEPNITANDRARFIVNVTDDGVPYDLTTSTAFTLASTRPDGQIVIKSGSRTGTNQLTFDFGAPSDSVPGRVNAKIQMYDSAGRVSAIGFTYMVTADPSNITPGAPDQTLIEQVLGEGPAILEAAGTATTNANTAATNANTTNTSVQTAEGIRVDSENMRESNETIRQSNESTRVSNESGRVSAETTRSSQESTRQSNESTRVSNESGRVSAENTRVSNETARVTAENQRVSDTNDALTNVNNAVATTQITWKEPVTDFEDIATTYPSPLNGWSVRVTNTNDRYRYNASNSTWEKVDRLDTAGVANVTDLDSMDAIRADLFRQQYMSGVFDYVKEIGTSLSVDRGVLSVPSLALNQGGINYVRLGGCSSILNGYKIDVKGFKSGFIDDDDRYNTIALDPPPTSGKRDDFAFLEGWFPQGGERGVMSTRIRKVAGVDFGKYPEGFTQNTNSAGSPDFFNSLASPQGGAASPITFNYGQNWTFFLNSSMRKAYPTIWGVSPDDVGLYVAGDGSQTSKDALKTADGYVYALGLFKVKRRNNGGYRKDNLNGARDYYKVGLKYNGTITVYPNTEVTLDLYDVGSSNDTTLMKVGDRLFESSTYLGEISKIVSSVQVKLIYKGSSVLSVTAGQVFSGSAYLLSDRPDGLYSNIIDAEDITDLRHRIPINVNYQKEAEQTLDQILQGTLRTKAGKTLQKDVYGLRQAPYGLVQELQPTRIQRPDGTFVDLVNLLGADGGAENGKEIFYHGGGSFTSSIVDGGNNSKKQIRLDAPGVTLGNAGYYLDTSVLTVGNHYLVAFDVVGRVRLMLGTNNDFADYKSITGDTTYNEYTTVYARVQATNARLVVSIYPSSSGSVFLDNFRLIPVPQSEYDLIDVNADWTGGDNIAALYPYTDSYPNFVENLFPDFTSGQWSLNANSSVQGQNKLVLSASAGSYQDNQLYIPSLPNVTYTIDVRTSGGVSLGAYNGASFISNIINKDSNSPMSASTFTTPASTTQLRINLFNPVQTSGTYVFENLVLMKGSAGTPFVPYGRWFLDKDYLANAHLQTPSTYHYEGVNGGGFSYGRRTFSDALSHDEVTEIIGASASLDAKPKPHIKVVQGTPGVWVDNNTIEITNYDGVITGLVDSDTAIGRVSSTDNTATFGFTGDISKVSAGNKLTLWSTGNTFATVTVSSVDTANSKITVDTGITASWLNAIITETTTPPTVTCPGIVGTWTGLGTHKAKYTITTHPTTMTDSIKIAYSIVYPAGNGYDYVPTDILKAEVNGRELLSANTVSVKANFVGKVAGNNDRNPHSYKFVYDQTTLIAPSSGSFSESGQSHYGFIVSLDGTTSSIFSTAGDSGKIAQQLFSFNIIRAIEDVYGEQFFSDCLTTAEKVAKIKTALTGQMAQLFWYGYGSSPSGNKASLSLWNVTTSSWLSPGSRFTVSGTVTQVTFSIADAAASASDYVDANGFVHFLAYAEASDGTTASTIYTDYVELQLTLNVAESGYTVLQPTNPFPKLPDNLLTANQAFPVDLSDFNGSNTINYNASTLSVDSLGVLKCVTSGSTSSQGFGTMTVPITKGNVSASFYIKGTAGATLQAFTVSSYSTGTWYCPPQPITLTGDWQLVKIPTYEATTNTASIVIDTITTPQAVTFYVKNLKINSGAVAEDWTPGRKYKKTLNFLGKVSGSSVENPHRATFESSSSSFPSPVGHAFTDDGGYAELGKQDGVMTTTSTSVIGNYGITILEFDLSHLGMSLTELKDKIRVLDFSWVGYGSGDNGGVLTYGAQVGVWNPSTSSWSEPGGWNNTTSTPSTVNGGISPANTFITNDQKIYILTHATYPASASFNSSLYTDYIKLDVTLSEQVDFVKANIVKIRPETKEIKLAYPSKSYRTGQDDQVALWTKYVPYQGTVPIGDFGTVLHVMDLFASTIGTGKATAPNTHYNNYPPTAYTVGMISGDSRSHDLILESLEDRSTADIVYFKRIPRGDVHPYFGTGVYGVLSVGMQVLTDLAEGRLRMRDTRHDSLAVDYSTLYFRSDKKRVTALIMWPFLVVYNGVVRLVIGRRCFNTDGTGGADLYVALFDIPGRPLVKGVN